MRPRRLRLDTGLIATSLIGLIAAWPVLTRPGLPVFTDIEQHIYRTFQVMETLRAGVPYARWAPDLFHGYGYPVFNYYAPLTYYVASAYGLFFGEGGATAGVKLVMVAASLLGSVGMYAFARLMWGRAAGVAAAAAFALAPYVLFFTPHRTGRVPEMVGIALGPLLFWAFTRLRSSPAPGPIALAALVLAAILLSHNLMPLIFGALLAGWLAWMGRACPPKCGARRFLTAAGAAGVLGVGLSLFFWLPAAVEASAVQLGNATVGPFLSYRSNFVSLLNLLAPPNAGDVLNLELNFKLGPAQWVLAVVGSLSLFAARPRYERVATAYFAAAAVVMVFLVLPQSLPVWDNLPFMAVVQFPSRLLGPAVFLLAALAGSAVGWASEAGKRRAGEGRANVWAAAAVGFCVVCVLPLLNPRPWADFGPVTMQRLRQAELEWEVGTTASNEFLPVTVISAPGPEPSLSEAYAAGAVDKVNRAALPEGAEVTVVEHGPLHDQLAVNGPSDFTLRLYTFDFPGWTAYVDGVETTMAASEPEGWITLNVPAGTHTVLVRLEDTWPRRAGWAASGLGLTALLILAGWADFSRAERASTSQSSHPTAADGPQAGSVATGWQPWLLPGVAAAGVAAVIGLNLADWPFAWANYDPHQPEQPLAAHWESNVALLGYDLPRAEVRPGEAVEVTLYWTAAGHVTANSRVFVHLFGPDGQLWANSDKFHPGRYEDWPTGRWPDGFALADVHSLVVSQDAPPGEYRLRVGLWNGYTGERVRLSGGDNANLALEALELPIVIRVNSRVE